MKFQNKTVLKTQLPIAEINYNLAQQICGDRHQSDIFSSIHFYCDNYRQLIPELDVHITWMGIRMTPHLGIIHTDPFIDSSQRLFLDLSPSDEWIDWWDVNASYPFNHVLSTCLTMTQGNKLRNIHCSGSFPETRVLCDAWSETKYL